jgi:hypothetical protein
MAIIFDSMKCIEILKHSGFATCQAEGLTEILSEIDIDINQDSSLDLNQKIYSDIDTINQQISKLKSDIDTINQQISKLNHNVLISKLTITVFAFLNIILVVIMIGLWFLT